MRGRTTAVVLWSLLFLLTLIVLAIVLSPTRPAGGEQDGLRLWIQRAHAMWLPDAVTFERIEWSANVVMFLPLGFLGRLVVRRWWVVVGSAALLSATVECVQHFLLAQRVGSAADVLANVTGAALGALFASAFLHLRNRWDSQGLPVRSPI